MLSEIENYLGANFSDLTIDVTEDELTIRGEGDVAKISSLEDSLKKSDFLKNVEIYDLNTQAEGSRRANFGIRAIVENYNTRSINTNGN